MKLIHLTAAAAVAALMGGAAYAQPPQPVAPTSGSVTGDWNGAHAPSDDKQYQEKIHVPLGVAADTSATVAAEPPAPMAPAPTASMTTTTTTMAPSAPAAVTAGADVATTAPTTFTNLTVTNGPVADTAENRAKYGQPMSHAGKRTPAKGN
ncbi:hypothetical protein [Phenylobacterium sp.]|uniref:hypothetical protein n=1 Tax=Phenylobacterium sp. TaxID=1871053 RepID=UPI0025EF6A30|nr:hypothetical protein [Phenylobacterium sp.]